MHYFTETCIVMACNASSILYGPAMLPDRPTLVNPVFIGFEETSIIGYFNFSLFFTDHHLGSIFTGTTETSLITGLDHI